MRRRVHRRATCKVQFYEFYEDNTINDLYTARTWRSPEGLWGLLFGRALERLNLIVKRHEVSFIEFLLGLRGVRLLGCLCYNLTDASFQWSKVVVSYPMINLKLKPDINKKKKTLYSCL